MAKSTFGTTDIAQICQVTPPTVGRWIKEGKLPAFTTGGGHHRVWGADLVSFLKLHKMPVPTDLQASLSTKILIVDDETAIRSMITRVIHDIYPTVQIEEAGDGFEAGQKVITTQPSLVILDLMLPGLDGINVCRSIRQNANLKKVHILAISGHNIEETRKDALDAGADAFLGKPFDTQELIEAMEEILS